MPVRCNGKKYCQTLIKNDDVNDIYLFMFYHLYKIQKL
jgi:hypothetical protein